MEKLYSHTQNRVRRVAQEHQNGRDDQTLKKPILSSKKKSNQKKVNLFQNGVSIPRQQRGRRAENRVFPVRKTSSQKLSIGFETDLALILLTTTMSEELIRSESAVMEKRKATENMLANWGEKLSSSSSLTNS